MTNTQKPFWFSAKSNFGIYLTLLILQSCSLNQEKPISIDDIHFDTRDDTEIFFKNIRQSSYELEENKPASINIFRLKENELDSTSLEPTPIIIHHWLRDKAYIWIEIGGKSNFDVPIEIIIAYPEGEQTLEFDGSSPQNHLEVALALFNASLTDAQITCNDKEILVAGSALRTNYQLVLNDYFRLLGLK